MSAIKKGYKQTKVGIIPEDWEVVNFNELKDKTDSHSITGGPFGSDLKSEHYTTSGVRVIQLQNIGDGKFINKEFVYTSEEKANQLKNCLIYPNEIILAKMAEPVARACLIPSFEDKFLMCSDGIRLLVDKNRFSTKYILEYINYDLFRKIAIDRSTGSTRGRIGLSDLKTIPLSLPPLKEQEKIAEILTTWDNAINKQEELIKTKELQKKALMQKLLSGEVRFSGFSDEWEEVRIKDIFEITRGYVLAVTEMSQEQTTEYKYPVYSSQTKNNGLTGYYKDYLFENCITWTTDGANAGDVNLRKGKFYCTNVCGVLKSDKGYANQCIAEILNLVTKNYVSYVGNPKLMNNTMGGIKIKIPKSLPEQQKIAEVLSLADDETNLLKNELEELKQQKKALMQKLLAGQVRVKV
ncbi:restriction endonuclease subunit S [Aliarcobacter butzleri]|uniref:restriction endonuclease subunit S n=1 Tax=Aliarcobacter butzleri TaxID=28197 RepID=UPI0024DE1BD4|nr:restriction endonuclease subunit S [Aliarcobacter butzleri]MDK2083281.1 restriction endonuclease subunit S [Aliarcobacter butzleri]